MIDEQLSINIPKGLQRHLVTCFLLVDPGCQRLLHHPAVRTFKARSQGFHLLRQRNRYMGCQYPGIGSHADGFLLTISEYAQTG